MAGLRWFQVFPRFSKFDIRGVLWIFETSRLSNKVPQIIKFTKVFQITFKCFCNKSPIIKILLYFNEKTFSVFKNMQGNVLDGSFSLI